MQRVLWSDVERVAKKDLAGLVFSSEKHFFDQVQAVAKDIFDRKGIRIIMIAGPSSSGKTTFGKLLEREIEHRGINVHRIEMDNFFIDRDKVGLLPSGLKDYDSPSALDLPLLNQVIRGVLNSEWVEIPEYDFLTGKRREQRELLKLHGEDIVIMEGIHALNPGNAPEKLTQMVKISLQPRKNYVMPSGTVFSPDELRLLRRTIRDSLTRGHDFEKTAKQWGEVCAAERKYITPYTDYADYFVDSAFDYELFVYKQFAGGAFESIDLPEYQTIKKVLAEVAEVDEISIPTGSLLNEFVKSK